MLFGSIFYGIGLLGVPGTILAFWIWRDGIHLLRADRQALIDIPGTVKFAYVLNACVMGAVPLMVLGGAYGLALFTGAYALVSVAHARCLEVARRDLEDVLDSQIEAQGEHAFNAVRWARAA